MHPVDSCVGHGQPSCLVRRPQRRTPHDDDRNQPVRREQQRQHGVPKEVRPPPRFCVPLLMTCLSGGAGGSCVFFNIQFGLDFFTISAHCKNDANGITTTDNFDMSEFPGSAPAYIWALNGSHRCVLDEQQRSAHVLSSYMDGTRSFDELYYMAILF